MTQDHALLRDAEGLHLSRQSAKGRVAAWRSFLWPESGAVNPIPALDGLRALAVVMVLVFHSWYEQPGYLQPGQNPYQYPLNYGRTGVHLFFVLSGFLLFLPYARCMFGMQSQPSAKLFYVRRLLRVGPAYWVCLALLVVAAPITVSALRDATLHVFFLSNAFPQTTFSINAVFWTMAVEVQYYAVLPLIGWTAMRLSHKWNPMGATVGVIGALLLISVSSNYFVKTSTFSRVPILSGLLLGEYSLPFWLAIFGVGIASSIVYVYLTAVRQTTSHATLRTWGNRALVAGLCVALGIVFIPGAYRLPFKDIVFGAAYSALLLGVLFGTPLVSALFASRPVRFVGFISYSCYLWHAVVIHAVDAQLPTGMPTSEIVVISFLLGGPLAIAVAYVSFQLFERPFVRLRRRTHETPPVETVQAYAARKPAMVLDFDAQRGPLG